MIQYSISRQILIATERTIECTFGCITCIIVNIVMSQTLFVNDRVKGLKKRRT